MLNNWGVSYTTVTEESAELGDYEDTGFEARDVSLREALDLFGSRASEANEWPITGDVRWFEGDYEQQWNDEHDCYEDKQLTLHIPPQITPSSRLRLARYLGLGKAIR